MRKKANKKPILESFTYAIKDMQDVGVSNQRRDATVIETQVDVSIAGIVHSRKYVYIQDGGRRFLPTKKSFKIQVSGAWKPQCRIKWLRWASDFL